MGSPIAHHSDGSNCYTKNCSRRNVNKKYTINNSINTPNINSVNDVDAGDNGYKSETIFVNSIVAFNNKSKDYEEEIKNFLDLPSNRRTKVFADIKTKEEFEKIITGLSDKLKKDLKIDSLNLSTSKNNRYESDLKENNTGVSIELKLGSETAVNAGISLAKEIFDKNIFSLFPTSEERENIEKIYSPSDEEKLLLNQLQKLDNIKNIINFNYQEKALHPEGQHILNSYFKGITNIEEIKNNYVNGSDRKVRKYTLRPDKIWEETTRKSSQEENGIWVMKEVVLDTSKNNSRLNIFIENKTLGYQFKMVLNGKNNGKKFGKKTPAKLLLNSFNCWFKPI